MIQFSFKFTIRIIIKGAKICTYSEFVKQHKLNEECIPENISNNPRPKDI